jgi:MFS-type transporter involved in bile tolerance (Atg22 family)
MIIGLSALPASLIAGILWDTFTVSTPFYFSLSLTILAIVLLLFVKEKNGSKI